MLQKKRGTSQDIDATDDPSREGRNTVQGDLSDPPWDHLLGLPTNVWEKLLSPSPAWHKRRFEAGINDLALVGWPVFVREDGTWRKRRKKKRVRKVQPTWEGGELGHEDVVGDVPKADGPAEKASGLDGLSEGEEGAAGGSKQNPGDSEHMPTKDPTSSPGNGTDAMTMFNVVFVMNPPLLEYHPRIREKYDNVIKKFGKGLKSEQARADYVWTEAQMILHIKDKARENGMFCYDGMILVATTMLSC
jgi:hypothetical protein